MSIQFDQNRNLFQLKTNHTLYQMKVNDIGILLHTHYGNPVGDMDMSYQIPKLDRGFSGYPYEKRLSRDCSLDLVPQEYSGSSVGDYRVSSISVIGADGSRSTDFRYAGHKIYRGKYTIPGMPHVRENQSDVETLEILLRDETAGLELTLLYGVFAEKDIITRTVQIKNTGSQSIRLEKAASMSLDFLNQKYDLVHFHGRICMERQMERVPLTHDIHVVGSRRGMTSHQHNPFVILCEPSANENQGKCFGFMFVYSGSHKTEIEMDQAGSTRVVMGIHDENFSWRLEAGDTFYAPEVILSYSNQGFNGLSQKYHRIIRENVCDSRYLTKRRPVLINNWEATYFDFTAEKILSLAKQAKEIGIEMLVLDDGWFGKRNSENAGLGDWYVNEEKLNGGLGKLSAEVNRLGLQFGLWFEPEMINEDSDLFRSHPEWVLRDPERKPMMERNQMVLDMSNKAVQDYLYDCISKVLKQASISYIKWDFNRPVANVYSNALPADRQGEVGHRFVLGTYALLERVTANYPEIMIEGCSGGGGRFDAGILYYCPQIWCSDNTDPIARLAIQKGTSYGYPVSAMGCHVSASPNHQTGRSTSLAARGVAAMSGTFGYELDLNQVSENEKTQMKQQIETFQKYYWLIQGGTYFRLCDNRMDDFYEAWEMVAQDQSEALVNFVMTDVHANSEIPWIRLMGLKSTAKYQVEGTDEIYTGAALMDVGYGFANLMGDYPAVQIHFVEK